MKRKFYPFIVACLCISLSIDSPAQGIYQFWGMTTQGGADDIGAIFRTDGQGANIQSVYSFRKSNWGATPMYNQLTEYNGKFYAMTSQGGTNDLGVIFEWDPATNIYTKKYDFVVATGIIPNGTLYVFNNKLYGMTSFGGANDQGVIFEWDPATSVYTKKYDFNSINGIKPQGGFVADNGKLYGMTFQGGANDLGVIFEWDPSTNVYTKKYDFDGTNGGKPYGDLALKDGKFYGMTSSGGAMDYGVIFEWDPASNTYVNKLAFDFTYQGKPFGSLVLVNNKFYGMTYGRSIGSKEGIIFEWDPSNNGIVILHEFLGADGNPHGNLAHRNGKLYALASSDFISNGKYFGYLYELDIATKALTTKYLYTIRSANDNTFNGEKPYGSLIIKDDKLYGMTSQGGASDNGVIFEFDLTTNAYSKKINLNAEEAGSYPNSFVFYQNKLYGVTNKGSFDGLGSIFEWDFASQTLVKKHSFDGNVGVTQFQGNTRYPGGRLTLSNGKFYGLSYYMLGGGGPNPQSHVFEWDPATNTFVQKLFHFSYGNTGSLTSLGNDLYGIYRTDGLTMKYKPFKYSTALNQVTSGSTSTLVNNDGDGLVEKNGKLYGTSNGGANGAGHIFEYDPATTTYTVKYDLVASAGSGPIGTMLLYNNKLYGMTTAGGASNMGVIFEWDPATNVYTKKYDFNGTTGGNPISNLIENNDKLYGMTKNGGSTGLGTIFEFDPATNTYTKQSDFDGTNGRNPTAKNELTKVPVEVSGGIPGSCQSYAAVNIGSDDANKWVPIVDNSGLAVAEIRANGNNLGVVNASIFINNTAVREDGTHRLYLDRSITITPQFQPTTPVDVRLYIRGEELTALENAVSSKGQSSGVNSIEDLGVFKNGDGCGGTMEKTAKQLIATSVEWVSDYVVQTTVTSFSTFYFANKANAVLPLTLLDFTGKLNGNDALLNWKTENELNTLEFVVERSVDGVQYNTIGKLTAANTDGKHEYNFTDPQVSALGVNTIHYRLNQKDIDGKSVYSKVVTVSLDSRKEYVKVYPNPVDRQLNLEIGSATSDKIAWKVISISGTDVLRGERMISSGTTILGIDVNKLPKGIYLLSVRGNDIDKMIRFVKQ